nr:PEP-CTERM sorting domain-containing protein [uncultured Rhodopila sp.]
MTLLRCLIVLLWGVLLHANVSLAQSSSVFSASAVPIPGTTNTANASASFSLSGTTLTLIVTNSGTTSANSSILDAVFFNTNTSAPGTLLPSATATKSLANSTVSSNVDYTGGWQMKSTVAPAGGSTYSYGISAIGAGAFSSESFTKGNGGDDYGLIGSATCPNNVCSTNVNKSPVAVGSIVFTIRNFLGTSISAVELVFNSGLSALVGTELTSGTGNLAPVAVPEPASALILLSGIATLGLLRRGRSAMRVW